MALHLFVVHFPVALLLTGAAADLLGVVNRSDALRRTAGALLILGAAGALLAFFTGQGALSAAIPRIDPGSPRLEAHTQWGAVGVWVLMGLAALRVLWRRRLTGVHGWLSLGAAVASAALVVAIALTGTGVAHG